MRKKEKVEVERTYCDRCHALLDADKAKRIHLKRIDINEPFDLQIDLCPYPSNCEFHWIDSHFWGGA